MVLDMFSLGTNQKVLILFLCFISVNSDSETSDKLALCTENDYLHCKCFYYTSPSTSLPSLNVDCSAKNLTLENVDVSIPRLTSTLDLSLNDIREISILNPLKSKSVTVLILSKNKITIINERAFRHLPNLKSLDLSANYLTRIETATFEGLDYLTSLNLAYNQIDELFEKSFKTIPNLDELNLNGNNLGRLVEERDFFNSSDVGVNVNLSVLKLAENGIKRFPPYFLDFAAGLKDFRIAMNPIKKLPHLQHTIKYLDISSTDLRSIDTDLFLDMPEIAHLTMNNMKNLTVIEPYAFAYLKSLAVLKIEDCKNLHTISSVAFEVQGSPSNLERNFKELSLYGSGLKTLPEEMLPLFSRLTRLDLRGNPWRCDCRLSWMLNLTINDKNKKDVRCYTPKRFGQKNIWSLNAKDMICTSNQDILHWMISNSLILLCITMTALAIWLVLIWPRSKVTRSVHPAGQQYNVVTLEPNNAENYTI